MLRALVIGMLMLANLISIAQKAPKLNTYVLKYDAATGQISSTEHIDTIVWFGNGLGLARVSYADGKFDAKLAKTKAPDFEKFDYGYQKQAWGLIDTTGRFKIPPIYSDVDVWGNKMGMMYKLQKSKKFCGYLYCYILDMNKGSLKYMGDKVDRAYFAGPDYIVIQTLNQNVGVISLSGEVMIDTTAERSLSFGAFDGKLVSHNKRNSCETPATLSNTGRSDNPQVWIFSDPKRGKTAVDSRFSTLVPWGSYSGLYLWHGSLVAETYKSAKYSFTFYSNKGKLIESNLDSMRFDEELSIWKLYKGGTATFLTRDLNPINPELAAQLNNELNRAKEIEAENTRIKEAAAKLVRERADSIYYSRFDPKDLAGMVAGNYKEGNFILDRSDPNFKLNPNQPSMISFKSYTGGEYIVITRVKESVVHIALSSNPNDAATYYLKPDPYYKSIIRLYDINGTEIGSYTKNIYQLRVDFIYKGIKCVLYADKQK
jgi:hypothetical protein